MRRDHLLWFAATLISAAEAASPGIPCLPCHAGEVKAYGQSAMAQSLSRSAGPQQGSFVHKLSGTKVVVRPAGRTVQISMTRDGLSGSLPVDYVIGSGSHAYGYLIRTGNYLFEAPISFYVGRKSWDMAPGYEADPQPDFTRPVTTECLQCHSGRPRPVVGTLNRFEDPPFESEGITCDRC